MNSRKLSSLVRPTNIFVNNRLFTSFNVRKNSSPSLKAMHPSNPYGGFPPGGYPVGPMRPNRPSGGRGGPPTDMPPGGGGGGGRGGIPGIPSRRPDDGEFGEDKSPKNYLYFGDVCDFTKKSQFEYQQAVLLHKRKLSAEGLRNLNVTRPNTYRVHTVCFGIGRIAFSDDWGRHINGGTLLTTDCCWAGTNNEKGLFVKKYSISGNLMSQVFPEFPRTPVEVILEVENNSTSKSGADFVTRVILLNEDIFFVKKDPESPPSSEGGEGKGS